MKKFRVVMSDGTGSSFDMEHLHLFSVGTRLHRDIHFGYHGWVVKEHRQDGNLYTVILGG